MIPQCMFCARLVGTRLCEPYPKGIPAKITDNSLKCEFKIDRDSPEAKALDDKSRAEASSLRAANALKTFETGLKAIAFDQIKDAIPERGPKGDKGDRGPAGRDGKDGRDGKSAYEIWLSHGNVGTEEDFLRSLRGKDGQDGKSSRGGGGGGSRGPQGEPGEPGTIVAVSDTPPESPNVGDLWVDTS